MKRKKIEPWRIAVFVIAVVFILFTWVRKDIANIYKTMPQDQIAPIVVTTIAVSLLKIAAIAGAVFLLKWIIEKVKKK